MLTTDDNNYSVKAIFGPAKYLRAEDLAEASVVTARIRGVKMIYRDELPLLEIELSQLGRLLAGKTMAEAIKALLDSDSTRGWLNREIGIYRSYDHHPTGGSSPCLRICSPPRAKS